MGNFVGTVAGWDPIPSPGTPGVPYAQFVYPVGSQQYRAMGHRYSGCAFQGNLFTIQARSDDNLTYYLDLQNNPYYATEVGDITAPQSFAISYDKSDSGQLDRAAPGSNILSAKDPSGAVGARFLSALAAGSTGAAYAGWMVVSGSDTTGEAGSSTPQLNLWPIRMTQGTGQRPQVVPPDIDQTLKFDLAGDPVRGANIPRDLCATAIGTTVYFFISYWNDPNLYYFAFDGEQVSQLAVVPDMAAGGNGGIAEIWSIDATTVYGVSKGQDGNSSPEMIAVAACVTQGGQSRLVTQLFRPVAADPAVPLDPASPPPTLTQVTGLALPEPAVDWVKAVSEAVTVGTSIRIGWGSPWGLDHDVHPIGNGLLVNHVVRTSSTRYLDFGGNAQYLSCVHLLPDGSPADQWQNVANGSDLLDGYFFMGAFTAGAFVAGVEDAMAYAVFLGGVGFDMSGREPVPGMYWVEWPCFRLTPLNDPGQGDLLFSSDWSCDQFRSAVPSWTLLGVIAGVPPVREGSKLSVSLTVGAGSESGDSSSATLDTLFGVTAKGEDDGVSLGGGFSYDQSNSQGTQEDLSFVLSETHAYVEGTPESATNSPHFGYLVYLIPAYTNRQFSVTCYDNVTEVPGSLTLNVFTSTSSSAINSFPFNLAEMNTPVSQFTNDPANLLEVLSDFPDSTKNWPDATDVAGWSALIGSDADGFFSELTGGEPVASPPNPILETRFNVDSGVNVQDATVIKQEATRTLTSKNQVDVDGSLNVSVFSVGGSYSHSASTSVTVTDSTSLQVSFSVADTTGQGGWESYELGGVILFAQASSLWWVPKISANQRPWLVTWNVSDGGS